MFDPAFVKLDSTRTLISALFSLQMLDVISCYESSGFIEVTFRVNKESINSWQNMIKRLLAANIGKIFIYKKYMLKDGELSYAWAIGLQSREMDEDALKVQTYVKEVILGIAPERVEKKQQQKQIRPKTTRQVPKPILVGTDSQNKPILQWEIPLPHSSLTRNKPKDGSTKGAFTVDEKGSATKALIKNFYGNKLGGLR